MKIWFEDANFDTVTRDDLEDYVPAKAYARLERNGVENHITRSIGEKADIKKQNQYENLNNIINTYDDMAKTIDIIG